MPMYHYVLLSACQHNQENEVGGAGVGVGGGGGSGGGWLVV